MQLRVRRVTLAGAGDDWKGVLKGLLGRLVIGHILRLGLGAVYMYAFTSCKVISCVCMICALFYINISPQRRSSKFNKNLSRDCECFRGRKNHKAFLGGKGRGAPVLIR